MPEEEVCGKVGWFSPTPFQALKVVCSLKPGHDEEPDGKHIASVRDLPTGNTVFVAWDVLPERPS